MLYNNLSGYLREKYGQRLGKICIDAGFSCPNRDGTVGVGGCVFCGERGSGEHIDHKKSIKEQVQKALISAKDSDIFIAYFQNFTNTYASLDVLKERYDAALFDERIKVLAIGTRPDCIDEEKAELIASYRDKYEVWVELGLQTASDAVADGFGRGYKTEVFERAVRILEKYGIPTVAHVIIGLPGDGADGIRETAALLSRLPIFGLKIHSIYVMQGTRLASMYERGEYTPPTLSEYIEGAAYILARTRPEVVIHRLTGDCPPGMLIAPEWNSDKHKIINGIVEYMEAHGLSQGSSL